MSLRLLPAACLVLALGGCVRPSTEDDFEARAFGAAYAQFPRSGVELVVSKNSGRPVACGYARRLQPAPEAPPGEPFIWVDGEMYSGDRLMDLREAEAIRLCGPNWVAPSRYKPAISPAPAGGTPAAPDRSPAV